MRHNEKKMVDAILTNNPTDFVDAFKDDMNNRVSQKLEDEKTQVSKNIVVDNQKED
jgi:hypothetical protein